MATLKPRITITLEPHRHELLKRVAALQGLPMSALVVDLIETVAEALERVCVVLEAAQKAPAQVREGLRAAADGFEKDFMPMAAETLQQFDMFLRQVEGAAAPSQVPAQRAPGRGAVRPAKAKDPRPVITGVRSQGKKDAKPAGARVPARLKKKGGAHAESIKRRAG